MNRRGICLLSFALLLLREVASAQTGSPKSTVDTTAFRMIRATVEFLATDRKMYGQKPRVPCQPCSEYADLNQFVNQNKLLGADQLIAEARKKSDESTPAELRTFLLRRVTVGKRSYRTTLPLFAGYQQTLDAAVGGIQPPESPAVLPVVDESDATAATANPDEPVTITENIATKTSATPELMPHLSLIALILSLISLVGVVTLFWQRSRTPTKLVKPSSTGGSVSLEERIKEIEEQCSSHSEQLKGLKNKDKQPSNAIRPDQGAQTQSRLVQPPAPAPQEPMANVVSITPTPPPVDSPPVPIANTVRIVPTVTVQYGRTADLGDGFSVSGLVATPDRDTVFEIHRQSDTAALYQVSDQPELQRLALSDPYSYLNETCSYLTQPRQGNRIQTDKPGKLSLQGDKWAIIEKAQISFQ